jgi:hypothetical protein
MLPKRDYSSKAAPDRVHVVCVELDTPRQGIGHSLEAHLSSCGRAYGFQTSYLSQRGRTRVWPPVPAGAEMAHLIVVANRAFDEQLVDDVAERLASWTSASIAFAYGTRAAMLAAEPRIEAWKAKAGQRLNFLFPDVVAQDGRWTVSAQKIIDNAVCDTVRVKYQPVRKSCHIVVPVPVLAYFERASRLYAEERLYLRAPTDGYFAMRSGDEFYITATFTNKIQLDPVRISVVHGYDRVTGKLVYSGRYLPSSDAVEAAILLSRRTDYDYLLHTHASRLFTRNPAFRYRALVPPMAYGEPELGDALVAALARIPDGFVIMAEHGDLFAGSGDMPSFIESVRRRCREARCATPAG